MSTPPVEVHRKDTVITKVHSSSVKEPHASAVMVSAWYMDESNEDQRLPHQQEPNVPVGLDALLALGVRYWHFDPDNADDQDRLQQVRKEENFTYEDVVEISPEKLPNYEQCLKKFYEEHLHTDDEIRYLLDGSGYFDVRNRDNQWIRISLSRGDCISLPRGIWHRFTLDSHNYTKAMRLFVGDPVWTPFNRCEHQQHEAHAEYVAREF